MAKSYMGSIAITEDNEARTLGSPSAWEILQELREAGISGLTAEEISQKLQIPISTVYNALNGLRAAGFIETRRLQKRIGRPTNEKQEEEKRTGKKKRIYVERISWGGGYLHEDFYDYLERITPKILEDASFAKSFSTIIDKIIDKMKNDNKGKKLLPSEEVCPNCKTSHEADEFIWALLFFNIVQTYYSEELRATCNKHGYIFRHSINT